jgi:serine/threonine protein phosphatase 1
VPVQPAKTQIAETYPDVRLYIIGDIHGRSDLLDQMIKQINDDIDAFGPTESLTITLGDYVDRGPDSRGVLERLSRNPFPTDYIALKGNHEALLETFLETPAVGEHWRQLGGLETLHSYRVPMEELMRGKGFEQAAHRLAAVLPAAHREFLASLKTHLTIDNCFFCHAGVRPNVPLDRQRADDLLWIRDEFLNTQKTFGKMIIHGHTPNEWPEIRPNRVNLDTGAFATGRLTCLVLDHGSERFLFTA